MRIRPRPGDETELRAMPEAGGFVDHAAFITAGFWSVKQNIDVQSRETRRAEMRFRKAGQTKTTSGRPNFATSVRTCHQNEIL
jgi:hypothetical protein